MFWRLLLFVLLAANIAVGGWVIFGQHAPPPPPTTDPGVPELQLLSAAPPVSVQSVQAARTAQTIAASGQCDRIGPFDTRSGMQQAFDALLPHVPHIQFQQTQVTKSTGWWVYLPAFPTQEQALATARALAAAGVRDYYVITSGDQQNTVSLGLFHDPDNARHRYDRIVQLGYRPRLTQREETLPEYWVDIALPAAADFDWREWVGAPDVDAQPVNCF